MQLSMKEFENFINIFGNILERLIYPKLQTLLNPKIINNLAILFFFINSKTGN